MFILIPIYFFSLFMIIAFIFAMMTYFYSKIIKKNIRSLNYYVKFKKIFFYFRDSTGIVDYHKLDYFIKDFFSDPKNIDFKKFDQKMNDIKEVEKKNRKIKKKISCKLNR